MAHGLGPHEHKLDPKLRMVANGSDVVNTLRAERSSAIFVQERKLLNSVACLREPSARPVPKKPKEAKRGSLDAVPDAVRANVFIELAEGTDRLPTSVK